MCNNKAPPWGCESPVTGFTMLRVRVRANAYFASVWRPFSTANRYRPNVDFNFSQSAIRAVVTLTGTNWRVTDCDILGTGTIFFSSDQQGYGGTTASSPGM